MALKRKSSIIRVHGLDEALALLQSDLVKIPVKTRAGMIAAGLTVQAAAQRLTPVDTGNLKASATTIWGSGGGSGGNFKGKDASEMKAHHQSVINGEKANLSKNPLVPEVEVVYTAAYAIIVHEDLEAEHTVGQAKFLEAAIASSHDAIIKAVKMEVGS